MTDIQWWGNGIGNVTVGVGDVQGPFGAVHFPHCIIKPFGNLIQPSSSNIPSVLPLPCEVGYIRAWKIDYTNWGNPFILSS